VLLQKEEGLVPRFEPIRHEELECLADEAGLRGFAHCVLRNGDGEISYEAILGNKITNIGDQYYGERAAGITSPPNQVTGMRLGTGTTAVAKTGAGAALVTYKSGSNAAIAGGFPTSSIPSTARRISWKASWAAGVATDAALAEAVIVNDTIATDATSSAANTIARLLLSPTVAKGAADTLELTWSHDLEGA
jgi:hypothetical protein